ncbi:MAG: amidase [Actinobacteria bacterium]|nr:amidase [Actinomycetota bacterium]
MRAEEYVAFDAVGLAGLVRDGEVTAEELLDVALAQVVATDDAIAAVVDVQEAVARASIAAGLPTGPLAGVPFLLKDLGCEAIDFPSNMGSRLYHGYRYRYDSELFVRLRAAGLVTFGRTSSPEFGIGPTTEAKVYGRPTRNPWNRLHVAGGSSGGSAAAVAAGVVPAAHGSDGGGSVRIPASSCGLFGVKPTRALLPDGPSAGEGWAGMAIDGFLTRSVRDTAALLDAVAGPDIGAPYYAPPIAGPFLAAINVAPRRLRIAVSERSFTGEPLHPDCAAAVHQTAALCSALGHEVTEAQPVVDIERFMRAWSNIVASGTQLTVHSRAAELERPLTDDDIERVTRLACEMGSKVSGADYLASVNAVHAVGRDMARFLVPYDMLLTATLAEPPALIGRFRSDRDDAWTDFIDYRLQHVLPYSPFTALANGTGQPAMSVPLSLNEAGLPVGTHFMARAGDDLVLMQLAAQLEQAQPWFGRRPPSLAS